jgi:hypothetical protein
MEAVTPDTTQLHSIDWPKVLTFVVGISIVFFGLATLAIQRRQISIQRQQAETSERGFRLTLLERRLAVFNCMVDFLAGVHKGETGPQIDKAFEMLQKTREHYFLFGPERRQGSRPHEKRHRLGRQIKLTQGLLRPRQRGRHYGREINSNRQPHCSQAMTMPPQGGHTK